MSREAEALERLAAALERISPPGAELPDFTAADAYLWAAEPDRLVPVAKVSRVELALLIGIDRARDTLMDNTLRFARGLPANNALLWGARGMGKSSLVKAAHAAAKEKHTPWAIEERRHWVAFRRLLALFGVALRLSGLYRRGVRNALDIKLKRIELKFENLPVEFDGYRILQLSDPHVDFLAGPFDTALELISGERVDLCVLTGDYRKRVSGPFEHILPAFEKLMARSPARDGIYAILGNHDCADMAEAFENLGIDVLINETRSLQRGDARIHVTGTDDVHYYYTDAARAALETAPDGFKIALIHSAELADIAANAGFSLYLAGHTHGGQVCLPGGMPIITHMGRHRRYASGLWRHGSMTGYTTTGIGVSGLPVRFNSRGEVVLITLRRC